MITLLLIALATSASSVTVAKTKVFATFRAAVLRRSAWFGALVKCPYCLSHWIALLLTALYRPALLSLNPLIDVPVTAMAVVALATVSTLFVLKAIVLMDSMG